LPDSANVFNDVIRAAQRLAMAHEITPPQPDVPMARKRPRRRAFWRLFAWGGTACLALAAAVLTSQTDAGSERLRLAFAYGEPAQAVAVVPPRAIESDLVTKGLAAQIRELAADRDRLADRVAVLERNLDDMTGSIKQQREEFAATRAAATQPPPAPPPASEPAPAPAPVATVPPPVELPALPPLAIPVGEASLPSFVTGKTAAEPGAEPVPLPPVRVAAVAASEPPNEPAKELPAVTPFGIDLGGAGSIEALRIHWAGLKANYGPLLTGLQPLVATRPKHPSGVTYRLVAGPLANTEEAAHLCARFPVLRAGCHPAKFAGAELAAP
jgi:hypothetical protein